MAKAQLTALNSYADEENKIGVLTNNRLKVCGRHIPF